MKVDLAEHAGFCFGVKRAVDAAFDEAEKAQNNNIKVYTYGEIIHNEEVIKRLEEKGVITLYKEDLDNIPRNSVVIIRSHGVGKEIYDHLNRNGIKILDTTCPFVTRIHQIVSEQSEKGDTIFIIGNPGHAEVEGTIGWCKKTKSVVLSNENDIEDLDSSYINKNITVVAQTTFSLKKFEYLVELLNKNGYNANVCRTICNATEIRQSEAEKLANSCDAMIVIGGRNSSNTQKLFDICKKQCRNTYYIQTLSDLDLTVFESVSRVGITAGASTPNYIIKEVHDSMSEESFADLLKDENPSNIHPGSIVEGKVIQVKPDQLVVNINYKSEGIVTANEYSNTPVDLTTKVQVGDSITVKVLRVNDGEGQVVLSYKRVAAEKESEELQKAFEDGTVLKGTVTQVLKGGLQVSVGENRVFIPASLISDTYVKDLTQFEGQELEFVLTEYDPHKRRVIGNRKKIISEGKAEAAKELFDKIKVGDTVEGTVKNITSFGAFIDLGGADGLLHISEMSWGRIENPGKLFKVGDKVKCFIKNIDGQKIALSRKFDDENPWLNAEEKYAVGTVVTGKVARMTDFGAFVNLEPGIDALLHVSQISQEHIEKPLDVLKNGQEVTAVVVDVKVPERKISISIKRLNEENASADDAE